MVWQWMICIHSVCHHWTHWNVLNKILYVLTIYMLNCTCHDLPFHYAIFIIQRPPWVFPTVYPVFTAIKTRYFPHSQMTLTNLNAALKILENNNKKKGILCNRLLQQIQWSERKITDPRRSCQAVRLRSIKSQVQNRGIYFQVQKVS